MSAKIISFASARKSLYDFVSERAQNVIGQRLLEARNGKGLSLSELSEFLGECGIDITKSTISKWERGDVVPSAYQLVALCRVLGIDDDLSYFTSDRRLELNAEGIKKVQSYRADLIASGKYTPAPPMEEIEYIDMPVSYLAVSAGTGEFLSEGNFEMVSFPKSSVPAGADFGVRVNGDSMEPVYHDGQIVWVQETPDVTAGEEGIFIYDGCGYIKLLQMHTPDEAIAEQYLDSEGALHLQPVLISYNKNYAPIVVPPESNFQIVGRVL
jgi:phage repressor protein C with HTH and peptisase S24 domain/DNA-binding transcriptional regulator YiaG